MNRRNAIKGLGLFVGYTIAAPTVIGMLQSCKTDTDLWKPLFYSKEEAHVVKNLIDLILPKTKEIPGALDVNVPEFLDLYISKTYDEKRQKSYRKGLTEVLKALTTTGRKVFDLNEKEYDSLLAKYLRASKDELVVYRASKEDKIVLNALTELRNSSLWAFKTSEEIGENVLAYDPYPGVNDPCITVDEATGGKAWSL